ncbi:YtxH domain-containing protein [Halalkalibacter akibai]|uniref:General stress protein n=1 Tax=Halalkalibacter akibai (strain ATCC 43226 / DSM 21942 / CIP 109018 / JCM 9157 / 1139) TaxID=1236973 RepID=W4R077_HALA3|nr:YtxH domain-containing protein [Halalkalibacter akibai]GAE36944.1 general stress protein [Halalkalibacter akibai JCM 9157]
MKNQKSVAMGTVVGGVVGATAALLTAPKSGEELREDISNQVLDGWNKTEDVSKELRIKLEELSGIINEGSENVSRTVKKKSENVMNEIRQLLNDKESKTTTESLRGIIRDLMEQEADAGREIRQVVENEIKEIEKKFNKDIKDMKKVVNK